MLPSAEDRLSQARNVLERRGLASPDLLSPAITESWQRCLAADRDPPPILGIAALNQARERAALLRRLTLGEMQNLFAQMSGTNYMVAFADPDGVVLDTICDSTFDEMANSALIQPGALWCEARCGTNALGTVARTGRATTVHGPEHFFSRYGALTCNAAPILAPDGRLAGVLDASSDCRSRQHHTHVLVSMAATHLENGLFRECHRGDVVIAFHSRAEYLHTQSAGLLAVDESGVIEAANARAAFLLHGLPAARGRRFEELFRTRFGAVLHAGRDDDRLLLEDRVGSVFAARLESVPRARARSAPERALPAVGPGAPGPGGAGPPRGRRGGGGGGARSSSPAAPIR